MPEDSLAQGLPVGLGGVVSGKYRLDHVLGAGGMGVVVAATQIELDRPVALKFLLPEAAKDPDVVARFSREARAAARIQGEHVARVLDVGAVESGQPYLVMEYLQGADLSSRIAEARRLPLDEIATYLLQACEALAEAHGAGIVHRDLKPANLFLAVRPDHTRIVKLLDFGISKAPVVAGGGVTSTQAIMGSPVYMSPEQLVSSRQADPRADIWSLGIVLYEALVGSPPFEAESMPQIVTRILHAPAPHLAVARPDLPPQLDAVVARCLEKDPAARFADVAQLAVALAPFALDGPRSVERISRVLGH
ncbi:MAG: serine/threonine-protein kinase, partial [Polyangiaceae bacterium]